MTTKTKLKIGLVMPIAPIDGLDAGHWLEVKKIITDALDENGTYEFETKIVSEGESVGLIHKRIVQGLYTSDLVICDVSCRNPNVMFELGMRLAFDKPTVIIKDDKTNFTFDAGVIEHLDYPRDLRFSKVVDFKALLAHKVVATYQDSQRDPEHSPFLKSYGPFTAVSIESTDIPASTMMLEMLTDLQRDITNLKTAAVRRDNNLPLKLRLNEAAARIPTLVDEYFEKYSSSAKEAVSIRELSYYIKDELQSLQIPQDFIENSIIKYLKSNSNSADN